MAYTFSSARAAALKKAQEASARLRRKGRALKSRIKFGIKDAVAGAKAGVGAARNLRAAGGSVRQTAKAAVGAAKMGATARNRRVRAAMARRVKPKGR